VSVALLNAFGRRFHENVIVRCDRWCLRFKLSYRDIAEILWKLDAVVARHAPSCAGWSACRRVRQMLVAASEQRVAARGVPMRHIKGQRRLEVYIAYG
jgi:transposase-like protein